MAMKQRASLFRFCWRYEPPFSPPFRTALQLAS